MSKLDELEALHRAATPGPWTLETDEFAGYVWNKLEDCAVCEPDRHEDSQLICATRNALPAILEALRAAQEMRDWYRKQMGPDGPEERFDAAMARLENTNAE